MKAILILWLCLLSMAVFCLLLIINWPVTILKGIGLYIASLALGLIALPAIVWIGFSILRVKTKIEWKIKHH